MASGSYPRLVRPHLTDPDKATPSPSVVQPQPSTESELDVRPVVSFSLSLDLHPSDSSTCTSYGRGKRRDSNTTTTFDSRNAVRSTWTNSSVDSRSSMMCWSRPSLCRTLADAHLWLASLERRWTPHSTVRSETGKDPCSSSLQTRHSSPVGRFPMSWRVG